MISHSYVNVYQRVLLKHVLFICFWVQYPNVSPDFAPGIFIPSIDYMSVMEYHEICGGFLLMLLQYKGDGAIQYKSYRLLQTSMNIYINIYKP